MIAKSRPRWVAGDFRSRSTFSRKTNRGRSLLEDRWICPPQDALLALDARGLVQRLRDRVVLAGKPPTSRSWSGTARVGRPRPGRCTSLMSSQTCSPIRSARGSSRRRAGSWSRAPTGSPRRRRQPARSRPSRNPPTPANSSTTRPALPRCARSLACAPVDLLQEVRVEGRITPL